jgi:hypothetical protein
MCGGPITHPFTALCHTDENAQHVTCRLSMHVISRARWLCDVQRRRSDDARRFPRLLGGSIVQLCRILRPTLKGLPLLVDVIAHVVGSVDSVAGVII